MEHTVKPMTLSPRVAIQKVKVAAATPQFEKK
jgi:hypothetical protein